MYKTCLFCGAGLGSHEAIECFPVGRRLAFDAGRGRLWVVCRACERWNLSPLEERWEAIEQCERLFRDSRLRVSTTNIGLARLREGLELVRIGEPLRPELAAWRYGDQFGRRRRRVALQVGLGVGAVGALALGGTALGLGIATGGYWMAAMTQRLVKGSPDARVARLPGPGGEPRDVLRRDLERVELLPGDGPSAPRLRVEIRRNVFDRGGARHEVLEFAGDQAVRAAGHLLPALNRFGASRRQVRTAVELLEEAGSVHRCFAAAARAGTGGSPLRTLPYPIRLALEMAVHEEAERRALEGELAELERAWREAEEIAGIADSLLLPPAVEGWLSRMRGA